MRRFILASFTGFGSVFFVTVIAKGCSAGVPAARCALQVDGCSVLCSFTVRSQKTLQERGSLVNSFEAGGFVPPPKFDTMLTFPGFRLDVYQGRSLRCFRFYLAIWICGICATISLYALLALIEPVIVRQRRLRAGQCWICGYSLFRNLSGRCPECGTPVADHHSVNSESTNPQNKGDANGTPL